MELVEISLKEIREEWEAIEGDKMDFLSWLRFNGLDINGDRYEYRN